jgi:protein-disulfide isomerase
MMKFYGVFGAVALVGLGVLGYSIASGRHGHAVSLPVEIDGLDDPQELVEMARGVSQGPEGAPITIVEFSDFQCPACALFAREVKPRLEEALVGSGQARFVYYDFPLLSLHPHAFVAARAARCAGDQGRFWDYHDELYGTQTRWGVLADPLEALEAIAEGLGMDRSEFETCLNSDRHAQLITANLRLGETMRLPGTPTVIINVEGQNPRAAPSFDFESIMSTIQEMTGSEGLSGSEGGG